MTKTKGKKALAAKHAKLRQLLADAEGSCEGNGFFLA